jgi:hypothetical protein
MNSSDNHSYDDRKFCAFVCNADAFGRSKMLNQFASIDRVDSEGRLCHNSDDLKNRYNDDKLAYLSHYRFNLTPENSNHKNYVSEKLLDAIYAGCVPIYQGGDNNPEPDIFNPDAIVFIEVGGENESAIRLVGELNSDKSKYLDFANQRRFLPGADEKIWEYYVALENALKEVIKNI